jgi:hypothetical protein
MTTIADMNIRFKTPASPEYRKTHVVACVTAAEMQGYFFLTLKQADDLLNQLQQAIWQAEIPVPEVEE